MKLALVIALGIALSACTTTKERIIPVIEFQKIDIPSQFLDCDGKKVIIPNPKTLKNKEISRYILKMTEILEECQSDILSMKKIIAEYNIEIQKINERPVKE
jgi:hypothetical protein